MKPTRAARRAPQLVLRWLMVVIAGTVFAAHAASLGELRMFDIPAQSLATALTEFSRLTHVQVVASAVALTDYQSPGVSGRMSAATALKRLLRGTPYIQQIVGSETVVVVNRDVANVTGGVDANDDHASADSAGAASGSADHVDGGRGAELGTLTTIVVTGARYKRSVEDSTAPIDVIPGWELQQAGSGSISDALSHMLPSFNLPASPGQDQSAVVRPASLRGLNGDQVLVLVNGKRQHASAIVNANSLINKGSEPVDLNLIPISMIDHVEVLRDGASAQYGSDAIAGVINFVLKKRHDGGEVSGTQGIYDFKDGFTSHETANFGYRLGRRGFVDLSGEVYVQNFTDRAVDAEGPFYYPLADGSPDPREATTSRHKVVNGLPINRTMNLGYNAGLPLGNDLQLYSFSRFSVRHTRGFENFRYANGDNDPPYDSAIYPDGFEPQEAFHEIDFASSVGIKGTNLYGWRWDLSASYGKDDAAVFTLNTLNATLGPETPTSFYDGSWVNSELTTNLDLVREFNIGLTAPLNVAFGVEYRNNAYAIKPGEIGSYVTGPYTSFCAPVPTTDTGDTCYPQTTKYPSAGAQSYNGFQPENSGDAYRDNYAGYIDVDAHPLEHWDLDLAGRFEHYSDFGDTQTGKIATRYKVSDALAVRATLSTSFRAPTLGQSLYATSTTYFRNINGNFAAIDVVTAPVDSLAARALGSTSLQPERSTNLSVGVVIKPAHDIDLTIDAYRIYVRHRILETGILSEQLDPGIGVQLQNAGVDPTTNVQYFTNAADTRTQGLDIVFDYRTRFDTLGAVQWSAAANWNQTGITHIQPNPPQLSTLQQTSPGFQLFDVAQQGDLTVGTPRNKVILGATYFGGPVTASLRLTRYGHVVDSHNADQGLYTTVPPAWITDLDLSYSFTSGLTVAIGADNLFDVYPPKTSLAFRADTGPGSGYTGFGQYDAFTPYGISGGFYYLRLSYSFVD